jgi:hypothetical protein
MRIGVSSAGRRNGFGRWMFLEHDSEALAAYTELGAAAGNRHSDGCIAADRSGHRVRRDDMFEIG